jgi:hypothetical protein
MSATHTAAPSVRFPAPKAEPASLPVKQLLKKAIERAIEKIKNNVRINHEVDQARALLESMPLTTEEFGHANNRLRNANRYVNSSEFGAASWELATLAKLLSRLDQPGSAECG